MPDERDRPALSESLGADRSVAPGGLDAALEADADLVFERSGPPEAPDDAIDAAGYPGQVVVEPWHGTTNAPLALGESYHRSHVRIRGSQVRQLAPGHADRRDEVRIVLTTIDRS